MQNHVYVRKKCGKIKTPCVLGYEDEKCSLMDLSN
jgi:hypothetical protein